MAYRQFVCWVRKGQPLGKKYRPQKTNIACFKHYSVETNCFKVGVIGNAVTGFQLTIKQ
jgi:hypothetical protein